MSNELIVIQKENALSVLSSASGVEKLIEEVRERVMSLEGGSLKTASGRKVIRSNAFKATKAKTAINDEYIKPLIESITAKIQPDLDAIQALKDNKKILDAGLDQIRKDVNAEVQAIEDELKRIEDEKQAKIEAEKLRAQIESDHEIALLMNEKFDREAEEARKAAEEAERLRKEQEEKERLEREARIAQEAKEAAEREAKEREERLIREAKEREEKAERDRLAAIEREKELERQRIEAEERARIQAEIAEKQRIEAEAKAKRDAEEAAERARLAEIQRQKDEEARIKAEQEKREANQAHLRKVNNAAATAIADGANISEETAKLIVRMITKGEVPNVKINY